MKKLLLQIMFMMLMLPMMSQTVVYLNGTVTDSANGTPIPNHAVYILSDSSYGYVYYNTVYTNPNGFYSDTIPVPSGSSGVLYVYTFDCNNLIHQVLLPFNPANLNFTLDFSICNSTAPCVAGFGYYISGYLTVQFTDYSTGTNGPWSWDFGDGSTSTLQNPFHSYPYSGQYLVSLSIGDPNTTCYDTKSLTIYLNDSTGGGCNAAFYVVPDSLNNPPNTFYFVDQSTGYIATWLWDFGDGTYQTITSPGNPNVVHTYQGTVLTHIACLTIQGVDSTCYDYTCDTINGSGIGCLANFTYSVSPNTSAPTQFSDLSQTNGGGPITSWNWNFGDPGSGTNNTSNLQNPTHLFSAAGSFDVCLTIQGPDSSCHDTKCKMIYVNDSAGGGCNAAFYAYPDSVNNPSYTFNFIDQSTGNINTWTWSFGDGASQTVTFPANPNITHTYAQPGAYMVCLAIQGNDSICYDYTCDTILVGSNAGCQAMFIYNSNPASGSNAIQFSDQSTGNPNNWMWSFGDSTYSTEQNPVHVYPGPGTYLACLTITAINNGINCSSTSCQSIEITDPGIYHQIYGHVFAGNTPIQFGLVLIFSLDSNANYTPYIDICFIDSIGFYHFNTVPEGNYLVYAIPLDSNGYLPTYYGDVLNWTQATLIVLGEPNNPYNINLLPAGSMPNGPGSVSGQINMGNLKSSMMDKMAMILLNEAGQAISFAMVSESGSFEFPTLDYGTYYLHAELSGITSDNVKVVLTPEKPHVDVVMTFTGKNILGIHNMNTGMEAGVIYPNPAVDKFNFILNLKERESVKVEIFNQRGQLTSSMTKSLDSGKSLLTLYVSEMAPGFYTLRISSGKGINISRKLLIAK